MPKRFPLRVLTPERQFYAGEATSVTVESINGQIGVLADHIPMVAALTAGALVIRLDDEVKTAFHSEGFMEVTREGVDIFCQACEWPHEIDEERAQKALVRAQERLKKYNDPATVEHSQIALMRAMKRINIRKVTK